MEIKRGQSSPKNQPSIDLKKGETVTRPKTGNCGKAEKLTTSEDGTQVTRKGVGRERTITAGGAEGTTIDKVNKDGSLVRSDGATIKTSNSGWLAGRDTKIQIEYPEGSPNKNCERIFNHKTGQMTKEVIETSDNGKIVRDFNKDGTPKKEVVTNPDGSKVEKLYSSEGNYVERTFNAQGQLEGAQNFYQNQDGDSVTFSNRPQPQAAQESATPETIAQQPVTTTPESSSASVQPESSFELFNLGELNPVGTEMTLPVTPETSAFEVPLFNETPLLLDSGQPDTPFTFEPSTRRL